MGIGDHRDEYYSDLPCIMYRKGRSHVGSCYPPQAHGGD